MEWKNIQILKYQNIKNTKIELVFIESMQLMNFSFKNLEEKFSKDKFKCLFKEFQGNRLEIVKQKEIYPQDYMNSFEKFNVEKSLLQYAKKETCK